MYNNEVCVHFTLGLYLSILYARLKRNENFMKKAILNQDLLSNKVITLNNNN